MLLKGCVLIITCAYTRGYGKSCFYIYVFVWGGVHFVSRRKAHEVHFVSRVLLVKINVWPKYLILNLRITVVEIRKGGDKTQKLD